MKLLYLCLTFSCYLLWSPLNMFGQTVGHVDHAFGEKGFVSLNEDASPEDPHCLGTQTDGKILIAGKAYKDDKESLFISRLFEDGSVDLDFGYNGRVDLGIEGEIRDIKAPDLEHIYITGHITTSRKDKDFLLIRLNIDGSIDKDFASQGRKILNLGGTDEAYSLTFQEDGKLLLAGNTYAQSWIQRDFAIVRLEPNGTIDWGFGNGGIKRIDVGKYDSFQDLLVQEDGKILVCGYTKPERFTKFAVFRLDSDGNPDPRFDGDGIKIMDIGVENGFCEGMALDKDQNILLMGHTRRNQYARGFDFVVIKLFPNGMFDRGYGNDGSGISYIDLGGTEYATGMHIQQDGNLLLMGTSNHKVTVVRINELGKLDKSFGTSGQLTNENFKLGREKLYDFTIQDNNKILLAGMADEAPFVSRVHGNPDIMGLEEILMSPWEGGLSKSKRYASLSLSNDFSFNVWLEGEHYPDSQGLYLSHGSGAEAILPIRAFAAERAYLQIGQNCKLTALWDTEDKLHIYLNGKYAYTFSE
ncbi:MAG: hypothetical protein AAFR87_04365 [Bacteroidota bacterium]